MDRKTEKYLLNIIREGTIRWAGRSDCLKANRKQEVIGRSKDGKPILKYFWKCNKCNAWFRNISDIEVDHIVEVGPFNGNFDDYIRRMYCDASNLQTLCVVCHKKKTSGFSAHLRWARKDK